jgi:hypothetical protein
MALDRGKHSVHTRFVETNPGDLRAPAERCRDHPGGMHD